MDENREEYSQNQTIDQSGHSANPYLIPASIVVAGVIIAFAVLYSNYPAGTRTSPQAAAVSGSGTGASPKSLVDDDPVLGDPNAPVAIVEFGDYECPFCKRFFDSTEKEIIEKYVKTGKAKFVYRDFPLTSIHAMAQKSAEASECAGEQGKFWPYHDILFTRQSELSVENFKRWAVVEVGLEGKKFDECLDSGRYFEETQKDFKDGQDAGVQGTPATFVNGRLIPGAVPFVQFERVIEEELKNLRR